MKRQSGKPFIKRAVWTFAAVAGVHLLSALTVDRRLHYKEISFASPKIPADLDGYTIAFLTDIHGYPEDKLQAMVERINGRGVSLVLLGGDFSRQRCLSSCLAILSGIHSPDGFYGVGGNHDKASRLRRAMAEHGMTMLENSGLRIRKGLYVAGVEDFISYFPDVGAALENAPQEDFTLLLSHNPDVTRLQDLSGVDLTLCGHTHGGEITCFGLWAPAAFHVTRYGQSMVSGWCKSGADTDVYISNGIGQRFIIRSFAPPQVVFLTLHSGESHQKR